MFFNGYLPKLKSIGVSLIFLSFIGCNHIYMRSSYSDETSYEDFINSRLKGQQLVEIRVKSDSVIYADSISFTSSRDSISFLEVDIKQLKDQESNGQNPSAQKKKIPVSNVISLSYIDRTKGFFEGLEAGCVIGATLGLFVLDISPGKSNSGEHPNATANASVGLLMGSVIGAAVGAIIGDRFEYQITTKETNIDK